MMKNSPLITTIIPTYRRPQLLERAINSVLRQTYPNFKVCVYDNASGDETENIVRRIAEKDPRVYYYCHQENIGALKNFQYGLMQIETPYFSFLSDDDFLLPDFYEIAMKGFNSYPQVAFSAGSTITMTEQGKILYEPFSLWDKEGLISAPEGVLETLGEKYPIWTGILFRTSVIEFTNGLDSEVGVCDLDFVSRIAAHYPFVVSKKASAVCVNHSGSGSQVAKLSTYWPSWQKMIRNLTDDKTLPKELRNKIDYLLSKQIEEIIFWIGVRSIESGDFQQATVASKVLSDELESLIKSKQLNVLLLGQRFKLLWWLTVLLLAIRRKIVGITNTHRRMLQKKHDHLTVWLNK